MKRVLAAAGVVALAVGLAPAHAAFVAASVPVTADDASILGFTPSSSSCGTGASTGTQSFTDEGYRFSTGDDGASKEQLRWGALGGVPLSAITTLRYTTLGSPFLQVAPYLTIDVDTDGDASANTVLVFSPADQDAPGIAPAQGPIWFGFQDWNAGDGAWRNGSTLVTLAGFEQQNPGARIVNGSFNNQHGGFSMGLGCVDGQYAGIDGRVSDLTLGISASTGVEIPGMPPTTVRQGGGAEVTFRFLASLDPSDHGGQ